MIKKLKLQKAVIVLILGIIALVVYQVMSMREMESSIYALEAAGLFFMIGALLFLYPIVFGKKDKEGNVQLDPEKQVADDVGQ
jgi:drug/metabolite transporter superfamily protein YnfA